MIIYIKILYNIYYTNYFYFITPKLAYFHINLAFY